MDDKSPGESSTEAASGSSRSVANLSLEKLYRKRAIDRENQRQLRHKNKARLGELEEVIVKLKRDLAVSESERMKLESSGALYKTKVASVISALQTLQGDGDNQRSFNCDAEQLENGRDTSETLQAGTVDFVEPSTAFTGNSLQLDDRHSLSPDLWNNGGFLTFPLGVSSPLNLHECIDNLAEDSFTCDLDASLLQQYAPEFKSKQNHLPQENLFYDARIEANKLRDKVPIWGMLPTFCPPMCPMDALVVALVAQRKGHMNHDENTREFTNANFPSVSSLLNPVLYEPDKPVASTIARHVASVIRVHTTPEKIALLYTMCLFIRWLICPTEDNYDAIPDFLRPTGAQLTVPHPMWIGTIGWPLARDRLIRYMDFSKYQDFASVINKTFSINWPQQLSGILEGSQESGFVLTSGFVEHVRRPINWTVGQEVIEAFPFLQRCMNVK